MARWLREPLLQFLLIGAALVAASELWNGSAEPRARGERIELTDDDLRQIALGWVAQGRPAPSPEQLRHLADARVREEILYREALALGLDENDTIVRRRLAQKMEFLFEDVAQLQEPTDAELQAWFARHAERFALPGRVTFRHLYFSPDRRGDRARDDAVRALTRLAEQSEDAPDAGALGDPFMFQDYYGDRAPDDVARTFGPAFASAVFALPPGRWAGPVESGYGTHLVRVDAATPARLPPLEEVEAEVRAAWVEEQRLVIRDAAFAAMRARYQVVMPADLDPAALAGLQAPAVELATGPR